MSYDERRKLAEIEEQLAFENPDLDALLARRRGMAGPVSVRSARQAIGVMLAALAFIVLALVVAVVLS
ncbi:DUF3040 domain-containing protein [Sphaerisporangium sp. TRM90804]|uniref:DUF3040 domain-containing protein n=1 Tax=Sphaerisporangium sp. TRM90804 TaxID=3031113 RepID=UPI00244C6623|nr:DUF3040 domain-containing protein [Sphaerisporangium sp. TRM90804]MDH2426401.1 DUF3040 domain-containing protein [Sphaerisporangium sp. TRM90804]